MNRENLDDLELLKKLESMEQSAQPTNGLKLLDYQEPHAMKLIKILEQNNAALDASDPGIGKTYVAGYICKYMNLRPIVICPKNVVSKWISVLKEFGVDYLMVVNYELIGRGKYTYKKTKMVSTNIKATKKEKGKPVKYTWDVPTNVIFIFDEVHRCKHLDTANAKLLLAAKETGNKIMMLSGTVVEKPIEFAIFAYILGFSYSLKILSEWIRKLSTPAKTIHSVLYSEGNPKASRLTIEELGDKFPDTQITADTYTMKDSDVITKEYEKIAEKIKKFKEEGEQSKFMIAKLQTEFRNIELLKIPTFIELANDYIENNFSVVIFVNYTETLLTLAEKMQTTVLIHGGQSSTERDECIRKFQSDESRIMIANIRAGGVGISLHDVNGTHPRVSIISPTQSATNLIQVLGRVHRAGGRTKSLQRIIFAANTPEDNISKMLFKKLANLSMLNDGDLESYYIDGLIKDPSVKILDSEKSADYDLQIVIDEQMEKIKHKNFIKTDRLSKLFPDMIDTISGANAIFMLRGTGIFSDQEILLLGEYHNVVQPCKKCKDNCIEIVDIVTYAMHALHPQKLDFYIESAYDSHADARDKFTKTSTFSSNSRITKLYNSYRHLLDSRYPVTENLRMHAVDIRLTQSDNLMLKTYYWLYVLAFNVFEYAVPDILHNMLKQSEKIKIKYDENKAFFTEFYNTLKWIYDFLSDKTHFHYVKKICDGDSDLMDLFKITKQKEKFIASHGDDVKDFVVTLESIMRTHFDRSNDVFNLIVGVKDFLASINHIDDVKTYCKLFVRWFVDNKYHADAGSKKSFLDILSCYMDHYSIFRMLRKFDSQSQRNVMFYGGSFHANNVMQTLKSTGYFKLIMVKREMVSGQQDCYTIRSTA
jgi:superfamily II DNA or RNA helicase